MAARQGQGLPGAHQAQGGWRHGAGGGADASAMCPAPSVAAEDPARLCPGAQASAAVPPTQHTHAHAHATHGRTVTAVLLSSPRPGWSPRGPRPVAACSSHGPPLQLGSQARPGGAGRPQHRVPLPRAPAAAHAVPTPHPASQALSASLGQAGGPGLHHRHRGERGPPSTPAVMPHGSESSQGAPESRLLPVTLKLVGLVSVPGSTGPPTVTPGRPAPGRTWVMAHGHPADATLTLGPCLTHGHPLHSRRSAPRGQ